MKVTTQDVTSHGCPPLFNVLIDGQVIPGGLGAFSRGRVLKMGRTWLPILDGTRIYGYFEKRSEAAKYVAQFYSATVKQ